MADGVIYEVKYLPSARQDMVDIVSYISKELKNSVAALALADAFISQETDIAAMPYAFPAYTPIRPLKHEYRTALVKNYLMFFWISELEKTVTVARVIYAARDYSKIISRRGL